MSKAHSFKYSDSSSSQNQGFTRSTSECESQMLTATKSELGAPFELSDTCTLRRTSADSRTIVPNVLLREFLATATRRVGMRSVTDAFTLSNSYTP